MSGAQVAEPVAPAVSALVDENAAPAKRPRIAVIGTGGTFAMHGRHRFDWIEYADSGVIHPIDDLLERLGELVPHVEIVPVPFRALGSVSIGPGDWLELATLIRDTAASDATLTGFVITHGTATLEETAWFLDLVLELDQPVVLTGAQRPANTDGSDAAANLRGAVALAAAQDSRGSGVLVAMGGLFFAARDVTKAASFELAAFEAAPYGPLGRIDADAGVVWRRRVFRDERPARRASRFAPILDAATRSGLPRVDIALSYAGADGAAIDAFVAAGARGIVCAGLAPGRPASGEREALCCAAGAGVVVVQATRAPRGTVPKQRFLAADGFVAGGDLSPQKLRIALMLILASFGTSNVAPHDRAQTERDTVQRILLEL
ncbi:L-asparaginase [Paraburkholderia ginsengiterrae]|uniref:L-asparaginase n=1 Tax=Paraburkholderia ginsengiterrae TaxID=1462993 RepID=A0A1A9N781_9BURK|nr:asparaginase [Paraburkholderia ginsengiterrae]OAJ54817.1 L-asparaginase [Paraburkholderia ginsengiterrae]OAJ61002.1 L-asparaginase [Paraburkholderia ginsengiterrae]